jgi:S1-C subfamily serine protease
MRVLTGHPLVALAALAICASCVIRVIPGYFQQKPDVHELAAWSVQVVAVGPDGHGFGSGTVVGSIDGHPTILTCDHVVDGADKITVAGFGAHIIRKDTTDDLALLVLDTPANWHQATVLDGDTRLGEIEYGVGYPLGRLVNFSTGYFGPTIFYDEFGHWVNEGSAPIWPGNSGGGVYVWRNGWKLAGVSEAVAIGVAGMTVYMASTINYTIPPRVIRDFLARPDWFNGEHEELRGDAR